MSPGSERRPRRAREFVLTRGREVLAFAGGGDVEVDASWLYHDVSWVIFRRAGTETEVESLLDENLVNIPGISSMRLFSAAHEDSCEFCHLTESVTIF